MTNGLWETPGPVWIYAGTCDSAQLTIHNTALRSDFQAAACVVMSRISSWQFMDFSLKVLGFLPDNFRTFSWHFLGFFPECLEIFSSHILNFFLTIFGFIPESFGISSWLFLDLGKPLAIKSAFFLTLFKPRKVLHLTQSKWIGEWGPQKK